MTPEPPYYAVLFTSVRTDSDPDGYSAMAERMDGLARVQAGFLGIESARGSDGLGITISYWASLEAIAAWREQVEHATAQRLGRKDWYARYRVRIARVEREYGFDRAADERPA